MSDERPVRFPTADLDVHYFSDGDGKVREMARETPWPLLAECLAVHLMLVTWMWEHDGERATLRRCAEPYVPTDRLDEIAARLSRHGLIDADERIPEASATRWYGPARARLARKLERDRRSQQAYYERTHSSPQRNLSAEDQDLSASSTPLSGVSVSVAAADTERTRETASALSLVGARGLPNLDDAAIAALQERTGEPWGRAGDRQLDEYDRLVGVHGLPVVLDAFDRLRSGKRMTARQLVWPAVKLLEPFANARQAAAAVDDGKRSARVAAEVYARRVERYDNTGEWDDDLPGKPDRPPRNAGPIAIPAHADVFARNGSRPDRAVVPA